ncbi:MULTISPECIES: type I-MYXAN CRISPR-associated protein Cas6/Cmx6 [Thiorhodovibrio]|uniref:type I-MYXAN CRISPR-associated protein Cas6/Cmx6 n=1 Tax=Thiorhodovibrio TaxID=61593 RepID=UPI001911A0BC|nr:MULTISPECIES: type I-MYXAN CRISPR-associated protein Cas6/Cmx6 [Thiorhodovibrio]MBK5970721.1 type I-MYXAN CRISPR-associated protein Cas6/Cmx6 [Thiorhodovibrio winogradskyi]WPL14267.1 CRISPR-associated endonuclease Cas6 [Thiorhodovibrio litoralis]
MSQGDTTTGNQTIETSFRVNGDTLPADHGYALYAALAHLPTVGPLLHASEQVAIQLIRGQYAGDGQLKLTSQSRLRVRIPAASLPNILPLAGQSILIVGQTLRIGVPQTSLLRPAVALYAHLVTTRNGQDEARFDAEISNQLEHLGIQGKPTRGKRRIFRVKDKRVVAHSLLVSELTASESIHLQEAGLGGRRKMGCGVFIPWKG